MAAGRIDRATAQRLALAGRGIAILALLGAGVVTLADVPGATFTDPEIREPVAPEQGQPGYQNTSPAETGQSFDPDLIRETLLALKNAPKPQEPVVEVPEVIDPGIEQPETPVVEQPVAGPLDAVVYLGGVKDRLGRRAFVSINGRQRLLTTGDEIEGWKVAQVNLDEIVFESEGERKSIERLTEQRDVADLSPAERRARADAERPAPTSMEAAVAERGSLGTRPGTRSRPGAGAGTLSPDEMREMRDLRQKQMRGEITDAETARMQELSDRAQQYRDSQRSGTPRR